VRRPAAPVRIAALVVCALAVAVGHAWGQAPLDPRQLQQLQQPRQAPLTLLPTLTVGEEFNDNILLNNADKRWDLITTFAPGIALQWQDPTSHLVAAYNFAAQLYERHPQFNHAFDAHNFALDGLWRLTPRWTLTAGDTFNFSTNTNLIGTEGVATGRDRAYGNALSVGAAWQATTRTSLRGAASWALQRFTREELQDSDVYRAEVAGDRLFTPRLTGSLGYEIGYFDIEHEVALTTHTPKLGLRYRFTETLSGSASGGPMIEVPEHGSSRVVPFASAGLQQRFLWGAAGVDYSHYIGTAGGLGGTTVNQSAGVTVQVTTLLKGLVADVGPRYSWVKSDDDRIDVRSFSLPLRATWRLAAWAALVGSYNFFHQRAVATVFSAIGTPLANDVDQNRLSIGLELGYPIKFD
jgi:hypothetical protein